MTLTFSRNSASRADGTVQVRIGSTVIDRSMMDVSVEGGLISFTVPLAMHGEFRFEGAFTGRVIAGLGQLVLGSRTTALARVELERGR